MMDLIHLDLTHLRFTVELGVNYQNTRQCAVEAGPFPTLEDAIVFAQSVKGRKAFDVLAQHENTNNFDVYDDEGLDQPLVGASIEGFTDDGTQFSYDLQWPVPITREVVLDHLTFSRMQYTGRDELSYKGRHRTWFIRRNDLEGPYVFELLAEPTPAEFNPANDAAGGSMAVFEHALSELVRGENEDTGYHITDE